jgi:hypothetical protein
MPNVDTLLLFDEDSAGLLWNGSPVLQSITVEDEGVVICDTVHTINFKGVGVEAKDCVNGVVNVYVPPPSYVSHFDTNDGDEGGSCVITDKVPTTRSVSSPTSEGNPFNIGSWTGGQQKPTVHTSNSSFSLTTTNACSFKDNSTTTIEVNINDADESSTLATHTTSAIAGNTNVTAQGITINVSSWAVNEDQYQGIVTVSFNINTILNTNVLTSGRFGVAIIHHNQPDGDYTYTHANVAANVANLFYDDETNVGAITTTSIVENVASPIQKSGVYYYNLNSTFDTTLSGVDYLNSESYPSPFLQLRGGEYGLGNVNINSFDGGLGGYSSVFDVTNVTHSKTAWQITEANKYSVTTTANIIGRLIDWANADTNSNNDSVAIDTYASNATRILEHFRGESGGATYTDRLESDLATSWTSTTTLASADGGTGLQVGGTSLFYPSVNYTAYDPSSGSQPNYSSLANDRYYYRAMWHSGTSHSNGIFVIDGTGVTEANLAADKFILEISLDGTNWYNCNELWTTPAPLTDGQGCRVDEGSYDLDLNSKLKFTLTTLSTLSSTGLGPTYWGIFIKITMPDDSTVVIDSIQIEDWT